MTRVPVADLATRSKEIESAAEAKSVVEKLRLRPPPPSTPPGENLSITPVFAVIGRATEMGLMKSNTRQVGARLPIKLLDQAKKRTGIASTTELIEFALANIAIDDNFATAFVAARGQLDSDLDVEI